MSDPRNAAHDKKVSQEKKHAHEHEVAASAAATATATATAEAADTEAATPAAAASHAPPAALEGSVKVLSQLKEMEFHSRAALERLAELMVTVDDELKQKAFSATIGDIFSMQDKFHTSLATLIEGYQAEVTRMQEE